MNFILAHVLTPLLFLICGVLSFKTYSQKQPTAKNLMERLHNYPYLLMGVLCFLMAIINPFIQ